jgi:DNA-directed RNA polymerase alpha subunit
MSSPKIESKQETDDTLTFNISESNVSIVNALRRTIMSDIPSVVFHTFPYAENNCTIEKNTTRFNNEIIKHRLSCVPIHLTDLSIPLENYLLVLNKRNEGGNVMYVTTEDFEIKDIKTGKFLSKGDRDEIFPKNEITNHFIEFLRLRPKLASNLEGEEISLTCKFSISTAKENSAYNQTSTCLYQNTMDAVKANDVWREKEKELKAGGMKSDDIAFEKKNWFLLDAKRIYIPDNYKFVLKTVGIYENKALVKMACEVLMNTFSALKQAVETDKASLVAIKTKVSTIDNCYDVILQSHDYTVGKVIEYFLYVKHYLGDKMLSYNGFNKEHPHDSHSILRMGFKNPTDIGVVKQLVGDALNDSIEVFAEIKDNF